MAVETDNTISHLDSGRHMMVTVLDVEQQSPNNVNVHKFRMQIHTHGSVRLTSTASCIRAADKQAKLPVLHCMVQTSVVTKKGPGDRSDHLSCPT